MAGLCYLFAFIAVHWDLLPCLFVLCLEHETNVAKLKKNTHVWIRTNGTVDAKERHWASVGGVRWNLGANWSLSFAGDSISVLSLSGVSWNIFFSSSLYTCSSLLKMCRSVSWVCPQQLSMLLYSVYEFETWSIYGLWVKEVKEVCVWASCVFLLIKVDAIWIWPYYKWEWDKEVIVLILMQWLWN